MDTATRLNINAAVGGSLQLNNNNTGGNVLLFGIITQGPTSWRSTTLSLATVANMDAAGNLFCNSVSNYGSTYTLKTINQTGYNAATTPTTVSQNAITSNQAMTTNIVVLLSYTIQPGVWLFQFNVGFNILTGPCVITGYRFGLALTSAGTFDINSIGNIQNHTAATYAALDKVQFSSSLILSLTAATNYTIYGTSIYSSGTFDFSTYFSLTRIS